MKGFSRLLTVFAAVLAIAVAAVSSAYAANGTDWENGALRVEGMGVAPANAYSSAQARMMARRAAVVDAYRQLAEEINGVQVDSETTVANMMVASDVTKTKVTALIHGARIVSEKMHADGGYSVVMEIPVYGVSNSLASVVMPQTKSVEAFPAPVAGVAPSIIGPNNTTAPISNPPAMSSAAEAPSGRAIGGYTGLIVDCSGLGLKPVMSPVIKNENGMAIYGYKNLDCDKVIANGMAGYCRDMGSATRAGSNPLVVKAVRVDNHNGNPVLSVADANRVLIENGATGFLDRTNVVFIR